MYRVLSFDVGTKNLGLCDLSVNTAGDFKVHKWSVDSCVPRGLNVNTTPIAELAPLFYAWAMEQKKKWLYEDGSKIDYQRIFIENQPMGGRGSARNLKTKILSHVLQCILTGEAPITFINPGLKLKDMPRPAEGKTTYRENKLYAISKTSEVVATSSCLNKDDCIKLFVEKKIKRDDLADAFLQGLIAGQMYCKGLVIVDEEPKKKKRVVKPKEPEAEVAKAVEPAEPVKPALVKAEKKTKKRKVDESV
jgi:hypothetical protein